MIYVVAVLGVLLASMLVKHTSGHLDYFHADKASFYIVLLTIGYLGGRAWPSQVAASTTTARATDRRPGRNSRGATAGVEVRRRERPTVASRAPIPPPVHHRRAPAEFDRGAPGTGDSGRLEPVHPTSGRTL